MTKEEKNNKVEEEKKEQPDLTGDESDVKAEKTDPKANKIDRDDVELKSPLKGNKAKD